MAILRYLKFNGESLPVRVSMHIFITNGFRSDFDNEAADLGATLHYSKYSRENLFMFLVEWRRVLRDYEFDVIHDHQEHTAGLHFLMGLGYLPKIRIAHLHNPITHLKSYSSSALRRATLSVGMFLIKKLATDILSTSNQLLREQGYMSSSYVGLNRRAIYCGFDTSKFPGNKEEHLISLCREFGWSEDSKILLFVGRLNSTEDDHSNQKNPAFALEVGRICLEKDPSIRMLVVGGGESVRTRLSERVKSWGLADHIQLVGQRVDVPRFMLGSHVFILPSIAEGLGMVVVEAQAAGLPSIVSDVVPRECAVENGMVRFLSLELGATKWAEEVLRIAKMNRPCALLANSAVRSSGFAIEKSVDSLLETYCKRGVVGKLRAKMMN